MMVGQTRAILPILRPEAAKEKWYRREEPLDSEEKLADLEFDEEYYAKTLKEVRDQRVRLPIGVTGDNIQDDEDVDVEEEEEEEEYDPHMVDEEEEEEEEEDEANNMDMEEEEEEEYSLAEMEDMGNFAGDSDEPVEG